MGRFLIWWVGLQIALPIFGVKESLRVGVAVDPGLPLDGADRVAFGQRSDDLNLFFFLQFVCHKFPLFLS